MPYQNDSNSFLRKARYFAFSFSITLLAIASLVSLATGFYILSQSAPTANLVIGQVDNGDSIDVSVCIQSTSGTQRLSDVSTWLNFQNNQLSPVPTIQEFGRFHAGNGYGQLRWQQVLPAPTNGQTSENWTLRIDFIGDGVTPGSNGLAISTTSPELVGRVRFNKLNSNPQAITLNRANYYSLESGADELQLTVQNVNVVCTQAQNNQNNSSSAQVQSSIPQSSTPSSSTAISSVQSSAQVSSSTVSSSRSSSLSQSQSSSVSVSVSSSRLSSSSLITTSSSSSQPPVARSGGSQSMIYFAIGTVLLGLISLYRIYGNRKSMKL